MIDYVIRDCGYVGFLPIIQESASGKHLYCGEHKPTAEQAFERVVVVWVEGLSQDVRDFKAAKGL